jgi:hypothetical protein
MESAWRKVTVVNEILELSRIRINYNVLCKGENIKC